MNIQNISGPDIIPAGISVNSEVSSRNVQQEENTRKGGSERQEENKGRTIDTYA